MSSNLNHFDATDEKFMREALRLARRGYGTVSPNPMVGAVLVKRGAIIGRGFHHRAGEPHAEVLAIRDALKRERSVKGSTLYVTLEPCSTHGRTPPCTEAIISAGITKVLGGATDPNPNHRGRGFDFLAAAGIHLHHGLLADEANELNESFNHWIVTKRPFVIVKSAMTLDGKIATPAGESKWITGERSRARAMNLRRGGDAILVGINTVLFDDPSLTYRPPRAASTANSSSKKRLQRLILDTEARTPLNAKVIADEFAENTTVIVAEGAPKNRVAALAKRVRVWMLPKRAGSLNLDLLLNKLGAENVTTLLVEGGGETNASFLSQGLVQRVVFFYAPMVLGGAESRKAVSGSGATGWDGILPLKQIRWRRLGPDLMMTARLASRQK